MYMYNGQSTPYVQYRFHVRSPYTLVSQLEMSCLKRKRMSTVQRAPKFSWELCSGKKKRKFSLDFLSSVIFWS